MRRFAPISKTATRVTRVALRRVATDAMPREQLAYPQLGFAPSDRDFTGCLKQLEATFFSIDNPLD
jgi:hypothetical protein